MSARGEALSSRFCATELEVQPFTPGIADFSAFPLTLWQRLQNKHWRMTYPDMLDYATSGGYAPLRRAIADYLRVFRSVQLDADQVIITTGTQQSLELCARLLADHGDTVWVEDPAYWGAAKAFMASGLSLHPVPVDDEGIRPSAADDATPPRLIYLTPSHQYPTGAVMSLPRRHQLLSTARAHNAWVLEDDYDSEYRFSGPPISALKTPSRRSPCGDRNRSNTSANSTMAAPPNRHGSSKRCGLWPTIRTWTACANVPSMRLPSCLACMLRWHTSPRWSGKSSSVTMFPALLRARWRTCSNTPRCKPNG